MFGQNNVASTWGQPQQNQQQQQPGGFGQPATTSAFGGTTNAFGAGGAFGQPQQQQQQQPQQPQANPMFGGLGQTSAAPATGNTGFGAFGSTPSNAAPAGNSMFGAPKPTTGFGAFGGTGTAGFGGGGTGAFGGGAGPGTTATTGAGMFGSQPSNTTTSAFGGTSGGLFGQRPATTASTTAFGSNTANPTGPFDGVAPVTTGSSNPAYSAFNEKDNNQTLQYQSISCMPAYRGSSFEELRWQDYQQGRKTAGAFGQTTFGAPAAQPSTSLFGQPAAPTQPTNSVFGSFGNTAGANAGTGTANAFNSFGQSATGTSTQPAPGGSLFGQQQQQQQQPQPQPQPQNPAFGAFGQQQPQQSTGTSLFGAGGAFGAQAQQPKPFGSFGTANTAGAFGSTGTNAFGQVPQQQPAANTGGLFAQQQQPAQPAPSAFGGFGTNPNANAPKSMFGQPAPQPTTGAFGGFSQQPQQNQPAQQGTQPAGGLFGNTGGGLFGQNTQQQPGQQQQPQQPTGGLFGNQPAQPTTGSSLFGNTAGNSLFGNNAANQQQQQQPASTGFGSMFSQQQNKPATTTGASGNLFGGFGQPAVNTAVAPAQQQTGGLFGNLGQNNTQPASGGLFGANNTSFFNRPTTNLGTQPTQQQTAGTSFFGAPMGASSYQLGQPTAAPQLTASIAQPIGAQLPIFNMLPPGPRAISLEPPKKKSSLFADIPTRSPVPRLQLGYTPAATRLRGFTSTSTAIPGVNGQPLGVAVSLTSGRSGALSLSKAANNKSVLGTDAFVNGSVSSPGLGSGGRQSVKKLVLDRRVAPSDLFGKTAPKITFSPALSVAAREAEHAAALGNNRRDETPIPAVRQRASNKFSAQPPLESEKTADGEPGELKDGDYYVRPSLSELKKMSYAELGATEGLVVGRKGYGEIEFLEPVDLTGLRRTTELLGDVVRFDDKECSVYPDSSETDKPTPGSGLNVAARITLIHCWALDKATREPIKDEKHHLAVKHLKRLKNMKKTHFETFDLEEGKWVFTVDHF